MFSQFFGNYLLENDLITSEELKEVLNIQDEARVKLGVLAVNMGFMNAEQIKRVHARQTAQDKLFGEIAVELGYLTEEELQKVLSEQKKEHHLMAQTLLDKDIMTLEELEDAYKNYKRDNELTEEEFEALKDNSIEKIVDIYLGFDEKEEIFKKYTILLIKNLVRFIDSGLRIKNYNETREYSVSRGAYQNITGDKNIFTGVFADDKEFTFFAKKYAGIEIEDTDELVEDSAAEFVNLQNGIFLVNCSDDGIELEMKPQNVLKNQQINFSGDFYVISVEFNFGEVDFILAKENYKF